MKIDETSLGISLNDLFAFIVISTPQYSFHAETSKANKKY